MAKAKTSTGTSNRKPKTKSAGAASKPGAQAKTKTKAKAKAAPKAKPTAKADNAADALIGLIESPLVADLLATAVTAAAATMLEHRLKSRRGTSGSLVRAVGAATAAAVGKQLADEFAEIRKATRRARDEE